LFARGLGRGQITLEQANQVTGRIARRREDAEMQLIVGDDKKLIAGTHQAAGGAQMGERRRV